MPSRLKEKPRIQGTNSLQLGKRISTIRKSRGITQIELAEAIGIDQRLISSYEVGRVTISAEMLSRIAQALCVTADDLLDLGKAKKTNDAPSLKIMKRLIKIEQLPLQQQKELLKYIDMLLKATKSDS